MNSSGRRRLFERISPGDIVPALLLLSVEAVCLSALISAGQIVKIAAIIAMVILAIFFIWRFYPKKEQEAASASTVEVKERIVPLDRKEISLYSALPSPLEQKLREAQAMKQHGNWNSALQSYSSALDLDSDCWPARWGIAFCKGRLEHDDAITHFEKLSERLASIDCEANSDLVALHAGCHNQISALQDKLGHPHESYNSMKRANDIRPGYPVYLANLIGLAVKAGKEDEARSWYDLLGDSPDGDGILRKLSVDELNLLNKFPWFKITFH